MPADGLSISKIGPESDVVLRSLFQHYIHDMLQWFEVETRADGSYAYDTSLIWEKGHDVYLAKLDDVSAGFAIAGSADEWLGHVGASDVHEFFVGREFRRNGFGRRMATRLWNEIPGGWLVRVLEANAPAVAFWRSTVASYSGASYVEEGRKYKERPWRFFSFTSGSSK
jgi:predicted acetyltransferase